MKASAARWKHSPVRGQRLRFARPGGESAPWAGRRTRRGAVASNSKPCRLLSFSGFTVLWVLWVWGPMESRALAEESGISKSTLTGVVKTLERLGFAARKPHAMDGRRVFVQATREGISAMRTIFPHFNEIEATVTRDLSAGEKEDLARMLRIMLHTLEG